MKQHLNKIILAAVFALALGFVLAYTGPAGAGEGGADWALNATAIEACSCPMFCPCYFNPEPAAHHGDDGAEHFCRFNMAYKVNKGHHGDVDLAGAKFWIAGDLGSEFDDAEADWAILTFDPSVTEEQRNGISAALGHVFPVKWKSFTVAEDAPIEWKAKPERAVARLDGSKAGEIRLTNDVLRNTDEPVVIHNLKYWGVPRNDGFVLMPNELQAYRLGPNAFEFKGTNGFMITWDITSADVAKVEAAR